MLRLRDRRPAAPTVALACLATVVANTAIIVSGGAVRLTDSGLGCPTWPRCTEDSLVPTGQIGVHGAVEFGNRLLTFAVSAVIVAAIVVTMRQRPRRPALTGLAWALLAGVAAQAVLGGVTVLTGLNPYTVMGHFLVSMALVATSVLLYERSGEGDGRPVPLVRDEIRWLGRALVAVVATVVVAGTIVTGSGPHAGDARAERFGFDPATVSWFHADLVFLLLGLVAAMIIGLRLTDGPESARRRAWELLALVLAQGTIGYTQYFTDLPIVLVGLHMLGAALVWIAVVRLALALRTRGPAAPARQPKTSASTATVTNNSAR
ncbi:MAG: COX15/CtaA family protein [Carbonactinosporaceae bacterium]